MKAPGNMSRGVRPQRPRPQVDQSYLAMAAAHMDQLGKPVFDQGPGQPPPLMVKPDAQTN